MKTILAEDVNSCKDFEVIYRRVSQEIWSVFWFWKWDQYIREAHSSPSLYLASCSEPVTAFITVQRVSQSHVLWPRRVSAAVSILRWLSNKLLSFSLVFKREAYCNGYVTLVGYAVPSTDLWVNFELRAAFPTSRGNAGGGNKSLHMQFLLFCGRRIELLSCSLALGIAGYKF